MSQYDVVRMEKNGNQWECVSNTVQERDLVEQDVMEISRYKFIISPLSETEVEIIVNRMDVDALSEATQQFYEQFQ